MNRKKKLWENECLLQEGRMDAHADFRSTFCGDGAVTLDGEWKIIYLKAPEYSPEGFSESLRGNPSPFCGHLVHASRP